MRKTQTEDVGLEFDLIDRLHKSLRVSGHTPQSLASVLGIHPNTINNYLAGRTHPSRPVLIAWAFAVDHGVTVEWLETGGGVGPNPPGGRQEASGRSRVDRLAADVRARNSRGNGDTRKYADEPDGDTPPIRRAA